MLRCDKLLQQLAIDFRNKIGCLSIGAAERARCADERVADACVPVRLALEALDIGTKLNKGKMKW